MNINSITYPLHELQLQLYLSSLDGYKKTLLIFNIPIYAIFIPFEILLSNFRHLNFYSLKETLTNLYLNLLNAGIDFILRITVAMSVLAFFYQHHLNIDWNPILYWCLLILGEDFLFWLEHYVDHNCRLFWAVHVTHHSSEEYNLTTGFRSSVFMPVYRFMYFIPLVILNFKPEDVFFTYAITQSYGILVHTQGIKKLPRWVEYIFVTPSHHRVHHASNIRYLDKNMGMLLIIWDRIFGTFTEEKADEIPVYGLTKPLANPHHPIEIVTHEWRDIFHDFKKDIPLKIKFRYLFMPPGWSHDGTTQTAKELQKKIK